MLVEPATEKDLQAILEWLRQEFEDDGEGFWTNRRIICRSLEHGELWVIREDGEPVAFQVGDYAADIVSVRKDRRRLGFGKTLFEASLQRAIRDNVNVLSGECSPPSSLPFWQEMGFERYGASQAMSAILVRRVLHRRHHVAADLPEAEVVVRVFREGVLYGPDVAPIAVHRLVGGVLDDGTIQLPCRIVAVSSDIPAGEDLVLQIVVNGQQRYFSKAKYSKAGAAGIRHDRIGGSFYLDAVTPETG